MTEKVIILHTIVDTGAGPRVESLESVLCGLWRWRLLDETLEFNAALAGRTAEWCRRDSRSPLRTPQCPVALAAGQPAAQSRVRSSL